MAGSVGQPVDEISNAALGGIVKRVATVCLVRPESLVASIKPIGKISCRRRLLLSVPVPMYQLFAYGRALVVSQCILAGDVVGIPGMVVVVGK